MRQPSHSRDAAQSNQRRAHFVLGALARIQEPSAPSGLANGSRASRGGVAVIRVQFGSGPNKLDGWINHTHRDSDIAKPLPYADSSIAVVFAEHVIEHVPFVDGLNFLREAHRILEPGGVLRLAFPDVSRFMGDAPDVQERVDAFLQHLGKTNRHFASKGFCGVCSAVLWGSGHKCAWTESIGLAALYGIGFASVVPCDYGQSVSGLQGIDGHHLSVGIRLATAEATTLEAIK
jgi:SAM-dependent methyltransferase